MMMQMPMQNGMQMQQGGMQQGGMQMQPVVWAQPNNGMNNGTNGTSNGMANSKQTQGSSGGGFAGPPGAFSGPPGTLIPSTQQSNSRIQWWWFCRSSWCILRTPWHSDSIHSEIKLKDPVVVVLPVLLVHSQDPLAL